jgi:hypothetical protein
MNTPSRGAGNFVLLRAGALRLALPQADVGAAEYMDRAPSPSAQPGFFRYGEGDDGRALVALSERMRPLAAFPGGRFLLTTLSADGCELSFAWDEVRVLIDAALDPQPLPAAMRRPGAPIESYADHAGELLLCSTAARVLAYAAAAGD